MADRYTTIDGDDIRDGSIHQDDLNLTNEPTDGQIIQINMPAGDFTAIDAPSTSENLALIEKNQINIALNGFRRQRDNALSNENFIDSIVDEYEDETGINTGDSINESYDSTNDLYSPFAPSLTTSPFAHYKMNDNASNTTVTDDGTGSNNGTLAGGDNTADISEAGKINETLRLDGTADYIDLTTNLLPDIRTDTTGSISLWVNLDNVSDNYPFWFIGDGSTNAEKFQFRLQVSTGKVLVQGVDNTGTVQWNATSTTTLSASTWYHLVLVQDGVEPKLYINGSEDTLTFDTTTDKTFWYGDEGTNLTDLYIGVAKFNGSFQDWLDGTIDDVRYYQNKALTANEVSAIYNGGSGTEDDQPTGQSENMTLISDTFTADATPTNARLVLFEEDVDSLTINTDILGYVSRDAGQTFTTDFATDDKLDITSHGFSNDDRLLLISSGTLPAGLDSATIYYVINATANDFEVSLTSGGSAVDITDDGTGTHTAIQVTELTLVDEGNYETGKQVLSDAIDISGQPSGTTMRYVVVSKNNKDFNLHGSSLIWD